MISPPPEAHPSAVAVRLHSRPKRVAFIIPQDASDEEIDATISVCTSHWAGRFWTIHIERSRELGNWDRKLIHAVDPDIVIVVASISDELREWVELKINPTRIIDVPRDHLAALPNSGLMSQLNGIRVHRVAEILSRRAPTDRHRMIWQRFEDHVGEHSSFIVRNFGALSQLHDVTTAYSRLPAFSKYSLNTGSESYPRPYSSDLHPCAFPIDLCRALAPRAFIPTFSAPVCGFQIVTGNTIDDVLYCWNRASLINEDVWTFWLPSYWRSSPETIATLKAVASAPFKLVSFGLDEPALAALAKELTELLNGYVRPIHGNDLPLEAALADIGDLPLSPMGLSVGWSGIVPLLHSQGSAVAPSPSLLDETAINQGWSVDVAVELQNEPEYSISDYAFWQLPRRPDLSTAIIKNSRSRIERHGFPSLEVGKSQTQILFRVPNDADILRRLLHPRPHGQTTKKHAVGEFQISDEGAELRAAIRLFGGRYAALDAFESPFWRRVFGELSRSHLLHLIPSTPAKTDETAVDVPEPKKWKADDADVNETVSYRFTTSMGFREARQLFGKTRNELCSATNENYWENQKNSWKRTWSEFVQRGVLLPGLTFQCKACRHRNWIPIESMRTSIECRGCLSSVVFDAQSEWSFRLNEMLAGALRYGGLLSVLQTLSTFRYERDVENIHIPSIDLYGLDHKKLTDIDLILMGPSKLWIGEVKSNTASFKLDVLERLELVADAIRPDKVILAAPGASWPVDIEQNIAGLADRLRSRDIVVEKTLLRWRNA